MSRLELNILLYLSVQHEILFDHRRFLYLMVALIVTILIDTAVVKIYDVVDKNFIPPVYKLILFSINSLVSLFLKVLIIRYVQRTIESAPLKKALKTRFLYLFSFISVLVAGCLIGSIIFQMYYYHYYNHLLTRLIIAISYGVGAVFIIQLSLLFLSWYRSSRNLVMLLFFVSMSIIAFNLILTAIFIDIRINDRPDRVAKYVGSGGDISGYKYEGLGSIYSVSSLISFFSIWITTAILMNNYRERLVSSLKIWIILSIPLVYFLITYFYQFFFARILISYLEIDPVTVSIALSAFLTLNKPIGGLLFAYAFWSIAKSVRYERNIKTYMIISGWGIFLIFTTNQAISQILVPYPPFGLATITIMNLASYLMLVGIYDSAKLVSTNTRLRKSIYQQAVESKLLGPIGDAEMSKVIEKTVKVISKQIDTLDQDMQQGIELDKVELKKYVNFVMNEVGQKGKTEQHS